MGKLPQLLLALTAFAPALLTYAGVSVLNGNHGMAALFVAACIVLVILCDWVLCFAETELESMSYQTADVEPADHGVFNLLLIYTLPLITRDLSTYNWPVWILVTFLFCLTVAVGYGYHFNPLLCFLGYHFYKVAEEGRIPYILVTKRRIYDTGEELKVVRIAEYVLLEKRSSG